MKFQWMLFLGAVLTAQAQTSGSLDLSPHVKTVRSINVQDQDWSDLAFLTETLQGVDMVLLGEQGHGDGAAFLAKTRLIAYLHEKLGFNVLLFESAMLDGWREGRALAQGARTAAEALSRFVFPVWTLSEQFQPLVQYIQAAQQGTSPLRIGGFDAQPAGLAPASERYAPIQHAADRLGIPIDSSAVPWTYRMFHHPRTLFASKPDSATQGQIIGALEGLGHRFLQKAEEPGDPLIGKALLGLGQMLFLFWNADMQHPENTPDIWNIRDRCMGDFLIFLKEVVYPHEKVMVWGANSHLSYNRQLIVEGSEIQMVPAAQSAKNRLGDRLYALAFTSAGGQSGTIFTPPVTLDPPLAGDLEAEWSSLGADYGFLDCRRLPPDHPLRHPQYGRLYGHGRFKAPWAKMVDGLFFIRTMTPSQRHNPGEDRHE